MLLNRLRGIAVVRCIDRSVGLIGAKSAVRANDLPVANRFSAIQAVHMITILLILSIWYIISQMKKFYNIHCTILSIFIEIVRFIVKRKSPPKRAFIMSVIFLPRPTQTCSKAAWSVRPIP